jgi:hypothetical protein
MNSLKRIRQEPNTFQELKALSQVAQSNNMLLYFDAVLNQKPGAEGTERCRAIPVDPKSDYPYSLF